ncbi:MAG: transposase domain-containing protein [Geminicoccaceae bacterium]
MATYPDVLARRAGRQSRRQRQLPARLVVYYVMALARYAQASCGEVLRCLLEGVRRLRCGGTALAAAHKSAGPGESGPDLLAGPSSRLSCGAAAPRQGRQRNRRIGVRPVLP